MIGPGKYDNETTNARLETGAIGIVLIVLNGRLGSGFSVQAPPALAVQLPFMLRNMADEIEAGFKKGQP